MVANVQLVPYCVLSILLLIKSTSTQSQCLIQNGKCTYNINLSTEEGCPSGTSSRTSGHGPANLKVPDDQTMTQMQQDFNSVKSDHENRIKELENSIQKVLRNAISNQDSSSNVHVDRGHRETLRSTRKYTEEEKEEGPSNSGSILLLQLQHQFNNMRSSLTSRTAELVDLKNKFNETKDLLTETQRQLFEASSKLGKFEADATVLGRENNILKSKLKSKVERLDYTLKKLNASESKLISVESQLYDIVRSESNLREELMTVKLNLEKSQKELEELKRNHSDITTRHEKVKLTLQIREEELQECYTGKTQTFCGFEDPELCGFTQEENGTDTFDWKRHNGRTPSSHTGPTNDRTCKHRTGHYMYIEASGKSKGDIARMFSPKYRGLNPQCIEFYYHMYGRHCGTLTVYSKGLADNELQSLWRVYGNQGNVWIKASLSVPEETARNGYQLVFEGMTEIGYEGDISIDNFRIKDGFCHGDYYSISASPNLQNEERARLMQEQLQKYRKTLRRRQKQRQQEAKLQHSSA